MKNLKHISIQAFLLLFGFLAVSCTDDDKDTNPGPDNANKIEYNGANYTIKKGFFQDGGAQDLVGEEESHYNHNFFLTDGNVNLNNDGSLQNAGDAKIVIMTGLLSPGAASFKTGTFEYSNIVQDATTLPESEFDAKYRPRYVMLMGTVIVDTDGDKNFEEETAQVVTGGTIKVSGTKPNYSTEYNLTLDGGKTLKGSFTGSYTQVAD